jgi:molybdate transport system substrate-binding protein
MWKLICLLAFSLLGGLSVVGCQNASPQGKHTITVAAAANLQFAFEQIEREFEAKHPQTDVKITFGSSGSFFAQLSQKAPYDLFFSADTTYPRRLQELGFVPEDGYFPYAEGRIVVWVARDSPLDVEKLGIKALLDPSVRKIAIANPKFAPYGEAAESAMKNLGVHDRVRERLVFGENITQTAHFIESGAADVGILALSLALAPRMKAKGRYWEIPANAHEPIHQVGVLLSWSKNPEGARQLRSFVTGAEGQQILRQFGYFPPHE